MVDDSFRSRTDRRVLEFRAHLEKARASGPPYWDEPSRKRAIEAEKTRIMDGYGMIIVGGGKKNTNT